MYESKWDEWQQISPAEFELGTPQVCAMNISLFAEHQIRGTTLLNTLCLFRKLSENVLSNHNEVTFVVVTATLMSCYT